MIIFCLITVLIVFCDQLSKYFIQTMLLNREKVLIENILSFTYVQNKGAAWGIFGDYSWIFQFIIPVFIVLIIVYAYYFRNDKPKLLCMALITGGALGNYVDRLLRGYVVDFIDFKIWPVFNFADICIVCGCLLVCFQLIKESIKTERNK